MSNTPLGDLLELAVRFKRQVTTCEALDPNVCAWTVSPQEPWKVVVSQGEPFAYELRFDYRGHRARLFANSSYLLVEVVGNFAARPFAINREEKTFPQSDQAGMWQIGGKAFPVFTPDGKFSSRETNLLVRPELSSLIRQVELQSEESAHFNGGSLSVYLREPSLNRVMVTIERLMDLAKEIQLIPEVIDLKKLPSQFHPLIALMEKWAVSDDCDREELVKKSSRVVLQALVEEVEPYLKGMDSYLDSFGDRPLTEEAIALGRLAECALEAKHYLAGRIGS